MFEDGSLNKHPKATDVKYEGIISLYFNEVARFDMFLLGIKSYLAHEHDVSYNCDDAIDNIRDEIREQSSRFIENLKSYEEDTDA